jgi:oxygen-independent coproporphyrinogen-3 oxidase
VGFAESLAAELRWFASQTPGRTVSTIFFGGGTPSLMPPEAVARVLDEIAKLWPVDADAEVTLEANPTSIEAENFRGYRTAGVNRVSVGVQALRDNDLKALGRQHSAKEALAAFRLAARIFPRVSFDMIYARPGQTASAWKEELSQALSEQRGHMSLYQLTIEPGTAYFDLHKAGHLHVLPETASAGLFELTQEIMEQAGLPAYEVSNHARPGHESRHNLLYWRYGEYAGIGPGAHSRLVSGENRLAISAERHPETWRQKVAQVGHGILDQQALSPADQSLEYLLMGMRISEGIDLAVYEKLAGQSLDPMKLQSLIDEDLILRDGHRISASRKGRPLLNALIQSLAA